MSVRLNTHLEPLQRKSLNPNPSFVPAGIERANIPQNEPVEDADEDCGEDGDCQETNLIELN
jgi:hypothetical protein